MYLAIIDLGSNSARMNIVRIEGESFQVLENIRTVVRLSEGMGDEERLQPRAVQRTVETMREFKALMERYGVTEVRAIATAALRQAVNRELLTEPLGRLGLHFDIISGEREAYYDYMGVVNTLPVSDCLIVDIGGASTELIYVRQGKNEEMASIPLAAVNMTEKYFGGTVATDGEVRDAVAVFCAELERLPWLRRVRAVDVVGLGGTIRALARMQLPDDTALHGFEMPRALVEKVCAQLVKLPLQQRLDMPFLGTGRADIISGGVIPLLAVMQYVQSPRLVSCVYGLREGVMYDFIKKQSAGGADGGHY